MTAIQAQALRESALAYPALPDGMTRGNVEALLVEIAAVIGLSGRRLQALLVMMAHTRPGDWTRPDTEPVCYMAQTEIARLLGKTERAVRADEAALSTELRLIDKRTAANGGRSSYGRLGLVFSRLIERVPELMELRGRMRAEGVRRKELRRLRSAFYRHARDRLMALLSGGPSDHDLVGFRDEFLAWPGSEALHALSLDDLEAHVTAARSLCEALDLRAATLSVSETSGRPEVADRSHLQDTTEDPSVACIAQKAPGEDRRWREKVSDGTTTWPSPCCGHQRPAARKADMGDFSTGRIYRLCGEDMQFRLDIERQRTGKLLPTCVIAAAIKALPELGIHPSAWEEAASEMGDLTAALCVIVTDANRTHPVTPVRNPGGNLRAMTRAFRASRLNLLGGLIGLEERRRLGQQP